MPAVGHGAAGRAACATSIMNLGSRLPAMALYVDGSDPDYLYVAHAPHRYPAQLGNALPFDNLVTMLMGNDHATMALITFPVDTWQCTAAV